MRLHYCSLTLCIVLLCSSLVHATPLKANSRALRQSKPMQEPLEQAQPINTAADSPAGVDSTKNDLSPDVLSLYNNPIQSPTGPLSSSPIPPAIGTLTSLLNPPPGFVPTPPLNDTQLANIPELQQLRQGVATITFRRSISTLDARDLNCGTGYINEYFTDRYIGIGPSIYRNGELCGLCARMYCVDSICQDALVKSDVFMVLDKCNECQKNDVVVSPRGMSWLSGVEYNNNPSLQVAWEFTSCAPYTVGGIKLLPSDNMSELFVGLNFSNLKTLIKAVSINGIPMKRTDYGYWIVQSEQTPIPLSPPYTLQLQGINDQILTVRLAALVAQDLQVNFDA